jgi:hypothetical protein
MNIVNHLPNDAITFWFNVNKERSYEQKQEAIKRWKNWKRNHNEQFIKTKGNPKSRHDAERQFWHSIHHISGDRSNGKSENLFVCETQKQHENLEMQLKQIQIELVNSGAIGFSFGDKKYFVAWKPLGDKILEFRNKGEKNENVHR